MSDARCVYVVVSGHVSKRILGVYATPEGAVGAHDGLWMESKAGPDSDSGCRAWVNHRALTWGADPEAPLRVIEFEVGR